MSCQSVAQIRPTVTTGYSRFDGIIYLVFHLVLTTQTVTLHFFLSFGEVQAVLPCEGFAYSHVPHGIVTVADGVPVIVHPVGHDVQVLVFLIGMTAHDILGVRYPHTPHIFTGDFSHHVVRKPGCVLVGEVQ